MGGRAMRKAWARFKATTLALLRQGMAPRQIAACVALGLSVSICPVLGVPTPLLAALALGLRLNLPLVQAVNYAAAPLQWLLMVPFLRVGEALAGAEPLPLSPPEIVNHVRADSLLFFQDFGGAVWHAALGWLVFGPVLFLALYALALPLATRMVRRSNPSFSPLR